MQKSLIIKGNDNIELNRLLAAGWKVHSMCPMPSSCSISASARYRSPGDGEDLKLKTEHPPQCLVILQDCYQ